MKRYEHTAEAFWQFLAKKMKLNLSFYIAFLSGIGVSKRLKFDEDWLGRQDYGLVYFLFLRPLQFSLNLEDEIL